MVSTKGRWQIDDRLYSAILRSLEQTHCARMWFYMSDWPCSTFLFCFEYPPKWCTYSAGMAGATWNCSCLGASPVSTIQPCTMSLQAKPHTYGVCVFSCNLPPVLLAEWRDLLRATMVTRRWNGYRNKSQHKKSTLEKKILQPLQQGFEPATFQSRVRRSNHWAIPAPIFITILLASYVNAQLTWPWPVLCKVTYLCYCKLNF